MVALALIWGGEEITAKERQRCSEADTAVLKFYT